MGKIIERASRLFRGLTIGQRVSLGLLASAALCGVAGWWLPVCMLSLVLIAALLPLRGYTALLSRVVVVSIVLTAGLSLFGLILLALGVGLTAPLAGWVLLTLTAYLAYTAKLRPGLARGWRSIAGAADMTALAAAVVTAGLLLFPFTLSHDTTTLMQAVGTGVDNIAHLNFVRLIEADDRYIYDQAGKSPIEAQLGKGAIAYPQGYHLNGALFNDILRPHDGARDPRQSLILYELFAVLWMAITAYLLVLLVFLCVRREGTRHAFKTASVALIACGYVMATVGLYLFIDGFQPQIASTALFLALLCVLQLFQRVDTVGQKNLLAAMAVLLVAGCAMFYLYIWPAAAVVAGLVLLSAWWHETYRPRLPVLLMLAAGLAASLSQAIIHLSLTSTSISKLTDQGGALALNDLLLLGAVLAAAAYLLHDRRYLRAGPIALGLAMTAGFAFAVLIYQRLIMGQPPSYYYFKSTYIVLMLAVMLLASAGAEALIRSKSHVTNLLAVVGVGFMVWSLHGPVLDMYLARKPYSFNRPMAELTTELIYDKQRLSRSEQIVSMGNNCLNADDLRLMRMMMTMSGDANPLQEKIAEYSFAPSARKDAYRMIREYQQVQPDKNLIIVAEHPAVRDIIRKNAGADAERLQFIDPYAGIEKPQTGCTF